MIFKEIEFGDFEEFRNHDGHVKFSSPSLQGREGQSKEVGSQDSNRMTDFEDREEIMETEDLEENLEFCVESQDYAEVEHEHNEEISDDSEYSEEEMEDGEENDDNKWDLGDIKQGKKSEEVFQVNSRLLTGKNLRLEIY